MIYPPIASLDGYVEDTAGTFDWETASIDAGQTELGGHVGPGRRAGDRRNEQRQY